MMSHSSYTKMIRIEFQNFSFGANGEFGPNFDQNYPTLYLMILCISGFFFSQDGHRISLNKSYLQLKHVQKKYQNENESFFDKAALHIVLF